MKLYEYKLIPTVICEDAPLNRILKPEDVLAVMAGAFDSYPENETAWVIFLNNRGYVKGRLMIGLGSQVAVIMQPREVLRVALMANATAFVVVHNHPSGDPTPSAPDTHVTRLIRDAAKAIDIGFQDHVIIGDKAIDPAGKGWFSYREAGII